MAVRKSKTYITRGNISLEEDLCKKLGRILFEAYGTFIICNKNIKYISLAYFFDFLLLFDTSSRNVSSNWTGF